MRPPLLLAAASLLAQACLVEQSATTEGRTASLEARNARATGAAERARALVLFPGSSLEETSAAIRAQGGRVIATFDEPAAIALVQPSRLAELRAALGQVRVFTGPVTDQELGALAPGAVGAWNHHLGQPASVPPQAARRGAPAGRPRRRPPLGPPLGMPEPLEAEAIQALRAFFSCLGGASAQPDCLELQVDPALLEADRALLEREREQARTRNVEVERYGFALEAFDGETARFTVELAGHPTGSLDLTRRDDRWLVTYIDP